MSEAANIELARRLLAAVAAGDESGLETLVDPSYRDHAPARIAVGSDGVRDSLRWLRSTFSDREIDVEDVIAADGRVVARVRFSATHIGDLDGIAATGRRVAAEHVHIWRVAQGRLAEHWMVRDDARRSHGAGGLR
jgi:predicted ester cyclase